MPAEGAPGFLNYRLVNRVTGAEIVRNLPHLHTSTWKVSAMQQGAPGSAALGQFTLPLHPPQTEEYRAYKALTDQINYGQRVEGYLGPVGAGKPRFGGIITGIKKDFNTYVLTGYTDLWVAHMTRMFPSEFLNSANITGSFFANAQYNNATTQELGENFSAYNAANYTAVGVWATTTDQGLNVIRCTSLGTDSTLKSNAATTTNLGLYETQCHMNTTSTSATNAGMAGVGGGLNLGKIFARVVMKYVSANNYNVDVQIIDITAAPPTVLATATNVFPAPVPGSWNFTLQLSVTQTSASTYTFKAILNGKDTGISYAGTANPGGAGIYFNIPSVGTANAYFATIYAADRQTSLYAGGTISSPTIPQGLTAIGGLSLLDLWSMVATLDGGYWRWTPGVQSSTTMGTLDYGAAPGTDRSASVRYVEGDNLLNASIEPNADFFATSVRVPSAPYGDSGGMAVWRNFAAATTYGVLEDITPIVAATDFYTLRTHASAIVANKTNLNNAKVITVLRDPQTADVARELDYITVHAPTLGLNNVKALILAYDFTEGSATQQFWLDQFAIGHYEVAAARMRTAHTNVASAFAAR